MRLFLDTNVLIDFILERPKFYPAAASIVSYADDETVDVCASSLTIVNAHFVCVEHCKMPEEMFRRKMDFLWRFLEISPVDGEVISNAYDSRWRDFEDSVQHQSALRSNVEYIVTRNASDFVNSAIPVISPDEFCRLMSR